MSLRNLPEVKAFDRPDGLSWDAPSDALARWADAPQAAESDDPGTISIYDVIGHDYWTGGGFTSKRMAAALRSIGPKDVTVAINSPGGDFFEGIAIYNLLREHPAKVKVKVMSLAASAASVIAMAGDEITMGVGSFLMIHNAWAVVVGNRNDLDEVGAVLRQFDEAMAEIYVARSGLDAKAIGKLMDAESFIGASDAVAKGLADSVSSEAASASAGGSARADLGARRRLDALLAQQGMPRSERRRLLREATGTHDAADDATPRAGEPASFAADIRRLIDTLKR